VKFRGFRIEPGEIAAVLSGFPGVGQCVVAVRELPGAGPRLVAYVTAAAGSAPPVDALYRYAVEQLPDHMVPSHFSVLDELPLTPSGKVDVRSLPTPAFDRAILAEPFVAAATPTEELLVRTWQGLLGVPEIGVHDDFFALGGDSLMAVELFTVLHDRLGRDLPLSVLAQHPTIRGLAGVIEGGVDGTRWRSLVPVQTTGDRLPLFCVHGGSGNVASFPKLARELPADQPFYAVQWDGLDGRRGQRTIGAMARRYLEEVRSVQPHGPYVLAGQCIGGLIAREMARDLLAAGEPVAAVVMYDSPNLDSPHLHFDRHRRLDALLRRPIGRAPVATCLAVQRSWHPRPATTLRNLAVRVWSRLGLRVPPRYRAQHGIYATIGAAWRYRVRSLSVPTVYFHTGQPSAASLGFIGSWTDGMLGWSEHLSETFTAFEIPATHDDILYQPRAVEVLMATLDGIDADRARRRPA
jgi:thioesterase domain-containing protein